MSARHKTTRPRGQLLLVETEARRVTVDFLVGRVDQTEASLLTFVFDVRDDIITELVVVLREWGRRAAPVAISMMEGPRGVQVEMSSDDGHLVLEPT